MKKALTIILSCFCLVAVGGCAYICLYEIYNSYFAEEPKNVITYHKATAPDAGSSSTIDKTVTGDNFDNSQFSTGDLINYTEPVEVNFTPSQELCDINNSISEYVVRIAGASEVSDNQTDLRTGIIIGKDDSKIYIATCLIATNADNNKTLSVVIGENAYIATTYYRNVKNNLLILSLDTEILNDDILSSLNVPKAIAEPLTGTAVLSVCGPDCNSIGAVSGYINSGKSDINYSENINEPLFYQVSFSENYNIQGSVILTTDGSLVGLYTKENMVIPVAEMIELIER